MRHANWLTSQPIAHRGLGDVSAGRPGNSLPAFGHAVACDVPFELDVQLTAGGDLVVVHDATVPTDSGGRVPVRELTTSQVRGLRIGDSGERVPLLGEVLDLVDGQVPVVLDVRRWRVERGAVLEKAVAAAVRGYPGPLALQSFDPLAVARLRRLTSDWPVGQISGVLRSRGPIVAAVGRTMATNLLVRPDYISYELAQLPSRFVDFWRRRGYPVLAFPVGSEADERRAAGLADNFFFAGYVPTPYRGRLPFAAP